MGMIMSMLFMFIFVMLSVAFFSLFERKVMSFIQLRNGPNKVYMMGFLQPIVDAMKLISKLETMPSSSKLVYYFSPLIMFLISMIMWILYPFFFYSWKVKFELILLLIFFSLSVYGLIMSGWYSNSKYSTIGSGRALSQSISYEIGLSLNIFIFMLIMSSMSTSSFMKFQNYSLSFIFMNIPLMMCLPIMLLSELNRSPFDLAEGESELVSGYSVEYGGLSYTLIFLSENLSLLWSSVIMGIFFLLKFIPMYIYMLVWIRATVPRIRFDKMMSLFWISLLPILLSIGVINFSLV